MTKYYKAKPRPNRKFNFTDEYKLVAIDPLTGLLATKFTPNPVFKRFVPGTEPTDHAPAPEINKIKERDHKKHFFSLKRKLSDEDKQLKTVKTLKKEAEAKSRAIEASEKRRQRKRFRPKPKVFAITGDDLEQEQAEEETVVDE